MTMPTVAMMTVVTVTVMTVVMAVMTVVTVAMMTVVAMGFTRNMDALILPRRRLSCLEIINA
ncbi:hypothetical protein [Salinithrix halophila]|uniref:Uncharacterized protein n=1 Tax=Salinithrix halophila TaxID=1485204 RepID=A0ABV8JFD8_9BACL